MTNVTRILIASTNLVLLTFAAHAGGAETPAERVYENRLIRLKRPKPLLADHPEFVQPVRAAMRYEAPAIVDDPGADLHVRAWRFSYNARGIIEIPNHLRAASTARSRGAGSCSVRAAESITI